VIRLCANVGATLHLIHPLGFSMDEPRLRRAGLDYHELASIREHASLEACIAAIAPHRLYALTTRATRDFYTARFHVDDAFLLGPETRGLPNHVLDSLPADAKLRIPLRPGNRSLNVSNAAAVALYEAWRQVGFDGAGPAKRARTSEPST
jgi:tRNA (cytidine/uridine-2'-O-)-methyltransferase